jgi:hypothetical protein
VTELALGLKARVGAQSIAKSSIAYACTAIIGAIGITALEIATKTPVFIETIQPAAPSGEPKRNPPSEPMAPERDDFFRRVEARLREWSVSSEGSRYLSFNASNNLINSANTGSLVLFSAYNWVGHPKTSVPPDFLDVPSAVLPKDNDTYVYQAENTYRQTITKMKARLAPERPSVATRGTGVADIDYDPATKRLSWKLTYSGLSGPATAAQFHGPANAGGTADVTIAIPNSTSGPAQGSATLTDAQAADLVAGKYYINIHTAANPGGEIGGKISK